MAIKRGPIKPLRQIRPFTPPRIKVDTEGKVSQRDIDHFSRTLLDYTRDNDSIDTYTPQLHAVTTNPDLGTNPTQTGIIRVDPWLITVFFEIIFGTSSSAGSGIYEMTCPPKYPYNEDLYDNNIACGLATLNNPSVNLGSASVELRPQQGDQIVRFRATDTTDPVRSGSPHAWDDGDKIQGYFSYFRPF